MNDHNNIQKEIAVALDIGTTKVCAIAGCLNEYGKIEVVSVSSAMVVVTVSVLAIIGSSVMNVEDNTVQFGSLIASILLSSSVLGTSG